MNSVKLRMNLPLLPPPPYAVHRQPLMFSSSSLRHISPKLLQNPNITTTKSFLPIHKTLLFCSQQPQHHQQSDFDSSSSSSSTQVTELLPPALREITSLFQSVDDSPKAKYQQLLHYASQLPPLHPRFKNDHHRVRGCVSQVWVRAFPDPADPAAVRFEADSDSALTKGLCALLVFGLSGSPASVIANIPPDFILLLGLRQTLTPSRNNGFLNMLRLMQTKALEINNNNTTNVNGWKPFEAEGSGAVVISKEVDDDEGAGFEVGSEIVEEEIESGLVGGGRKERIEKVLKKGLSPVELVVEDISHFHAGHAGIAGNKRGETHFKVRAVSEVFEGKSLVKRHRLVYGLLDDEMKNGLHSLSILAITPSEANNNSTSV